MGKAIGGLPEAAPLAVAADAEERFALGSWLARQRELRGISREELSALTRLPLRSLERLEAGAYDGQQDGFVRGFVRTVALAIGLDPADAVARLLAEPAMRPGRSGPDVRRLALLGLAVALAAALLVGAFGLLRSLLGRGVGAEVAPIVRHDPVRALAIEHGLLSGDPAGGDASEALPPPPPPPLGAGAAEAEAAPAPAPAPD
jgi:hypothetical protein